MNTVSLVERLTRAPEARSTKDGQSVTRMRLAVPRPGDDNSPVYVDVVAWGRLAETCAEYLAQGRQVAVSGRLDYSEWNDAELKSRLGHTMMLACEHSEATKCHHPRSHLRRPGRRREGGQ